MLAGDLDRRITIERAALTANEFNEPIATWSEYATIWANRKDASAAESYRAQEVGAQITTRFTVRWSTDVADVGPKDRLASEGRSFEIVSAREIGRQQWLEIDAVARAE